MNPVKESIREYRGSMWMIDATCDCDYCESLIQSALVECVVFGDGKYQEINIKTPDHKSVIPVENWSA